MQTYSIDISANKLVSEQQLNLLINDFVKKLKAINANAKIKKTANAKKRMELFKKKYFDKIPVSSLMDDIQYDKTRHQKYAK